MSIHVMSYVWKQSIGDCAKKMVLLKLADSANDDGVCCPSQDRLASECEMSRRTVQRKIEELVADGFLKKWKQRTEGGSFAYNCYQITPCATMRQSDARPAHRAPKLDALTIREEIKEETATDEPEEDFEFEKGAARQIESLDDPSFGAGVAVALEASDSGVAKIGNKVVESYVDASTEVGSVYPRSNLARLGGEGKLLSEEGISDEILLKAATMAGEKGFASIRPFVAEASIILTKDANGTTELEARFKEFVEPGWPTGCTFKRGSHSGTCVWDPLGRDRPSESDWGYPRPTKKQIMEALRDDRVHA